MALALLSHIMSRRANLKNCDLVVKGHYQQMTEQPVSLQWPARLLQDDKGHWLQIQFIYVRGFHLRLSKAVEAVNWKKSVYAVAT
jgi:hypothetical protein